MDLKSRVGEALGPYQEKITKEKVQAFSKAVCSQNLDQIPPTFLTRLREAEFALIAQFGVPLSTVLHGEQEYTYLRPLRLDQELSFTTKFSGFAQKKSSSFSLNFLTFESEVKDAETQELHAISKTKVIVRESLQSESEGLG
jgi:hypothetical protein